MAMPWCVETKEDVTTCARSTNTSEDTESTLPPHQLLLLPLLLLPRSFLVPRAVSTLDQLTMVQRAAIITLDMIGHSRSQTAQEIPCSVNTVGHWVRRWNDERSLEDSERSGRPRCTDDDTDEKVEEMAEEKKFTVPKAIKSQLELDCSARMVRRRLDEVGLFGRVARSEYVLTERDIQRRLSFAQGYANRQRMTGGG